MEVKDVRIYSVRKLSSAMGLAIATFMFLYGQCSKELQENNSCILACLFLRLHRSKSLDVARYTYVF